LACPSLFLPVSFQVTSTTVIYSLSLHDALPICVEFRPPARGAGAQQGGEGPPLPGQDFRLLGRPDDAGLHPDAGPGLELRLHRVDRKSTRLNSSHVAISYAVFCLKKKKKKRNCT